MEFHGTKLFFNWRYQSSMEFHGIFHGTLVSFEMALPNSMESHGTRWFYLATPDFHWIPRDIPCKSRVTWYWLEWQSQVSMEFHGTQWYFIWRHQRSMEFHGIFRRWPWNACVIWNGAFLVPCNRMELGVFLFGDSRVPWNSMEYPMEVQGNMVLNKMTISKFHGIPWNLLIFHFAAPELLGIQWNILWNSMEHLCHLEWRPLNSNESLGTRWFSYLATPELHGITWTPDILPLRPLTWNRNKCPCFCTFPLEFGGVGDLHTHQNRRVVC